MAVVAEPILEEQATSASPFSEHARAQYGALAAMRWSMFRNSVRSTKGAIELGARTVSTLVFCLMGLGLAFGLGVGAFFTVRKSQWLILALLFWAVLLIWQVVPITLAAFQQQFDMASLLRFPLSFPMFYTLNLIFGLIDVSTIMGGFCCMGVWVGITVAKPELSGWAALMLLVFGLFNVLLVRAIFAWIDRWLAQRRTREIVTAIFLVAVLCLQFLNPAFGMVKYRSPNSPQARATRMKRQAEFGPWIDRATAVQNWLPPGLAARVVSGAAEGSPAAGLPLLALLALYAAAPGLALGSRLHAEFRGENLGEAPSRKQAQTRGSSGWRLDGSGPIAAVIEKEIRTLMRAMPLLYALGAPLLMVFIFAGVFHSRGGARFQWVLLVSLAYAILGFTQLLYNNLGTEGTGIQVLFLSPTPFRTVILAKNLFHSALFALDAVLVTILASLRYGFPSAIILAATWAWLLFALPMHLAAGNLFSMWMPYRINLGRIGRQKGAQANALLSMVVQVGVLGVGAGVLFLCSLYAKLWLAIPVFVLMGAIAVVVWLRVLAHVDEIAYRQREDLVAELVRTE
jgi:ABC-2 type transport system permease protein